MTHKYEKIRLWIIVGLVNHSVITIDDHTHWYHTSTYMSFNTNIVESHWSMQNTFVTHSVEKTKKVCVVEKLWYNLCLVWNNLNFCVDGSCYQKHVRIFIFFIDSQWFLWYNWWCWVDWFVMVDTKIRKKDWCLRQIVI